MGIFLVALFIGLVGLVLLIIKKTNSKKIVKIIATTMCVLSAVVLIVAGTITIMVQSFKDVDYHNCRYERSLLEFRQEADTVANDGSLYSEITDFNNNLRVTKFLANSFWTNCFYNDEIATLDYVEIHEQVKERQPHFK